MNTLKVYSPCDPNFAVMIMISSGLWIDQAPGAESVAGVCLVLRPGPSLWRAAPLVAPDWLPPDSIIDLLGTFEHPVDTRPRSYQKAIMLALTDLPPLTDNEQPFPVDVALARQNIVDPEWMMLTPPARPFTAPSNLWSRARRWSTGWDASQNLRVGRVRESELRWEPGSNAPSILGEPVGSRLHDLALAQAALLFSPVPKGAQEIS